MENPPKRKKVNVCQDRLKLQSEMTSKKKRKTEMNENYEITRKRKRDPESFQSCSKGPELKSGTTLRKRKRTKDDYVKRGRTDDSSEASCSFAVRQTIKNHLKGKHVDSSHDKPEPQFKQTPSKNNRIINTEEEKWFIQKISRYRLGKSHILYDKIYHNSANVQISEKLKYRIYNAF